jgi:dihydroflavonol-4-reductase
MKVLVTGGTGFVGSHSTAALLAAGHDVRLLVRNRARLAPALDPLGITVDDVVDGDCTDAAAVAAALDGCEAVLHCANVFTWSPARQTHLVETNIAATEHVLRPAVERGLDPVVHVSSVVALLPSAHPLRPSAPLGDARSGYAASKAASERLARALQAEGAPVVITYPGAVIGPHDPYLGDSSMLLRDLVKSRRPIAFGSLGWVDARDVAAAHAALMTPGHGPRRVMLSGHDVQAADVARRAAAVTGQSSKPVTPPVPVLRALGRVFDALGKLPGGDSLPGSSGGIEVMLGYPGADADEAGDVTYRPFEETLRDTVAWMREAGHLRPSRESARETQPR